MKDSSAFVFGSPSPQRVPEGEIWVWMMGLVKGHCGWCTSGVGMDDGVGEGTLWLVHQWGGDMDDGVGEGTLWLVHQWGGDG